MIASAVCARPGGRGIPRRGRTASCRGTHTFEILIAFEQNAILAYSFSDGQPAEAHPWLAEPWRDDPAEQQNSTTGSTRMSDQLIKAAELWERPGVRRAQDRV